MKVKKHYYLMISCPGDVVRERELLKDCIDSINVEREDDVWVESCFWATDTSSDAAMPAQDSINQQIVDNSDGLIAIFNGRLGTPVHEYKCGTDEEIALMLKANKHVSMLFNTNPTINLSKNDCIEQIKNLREYKLDQSKKAYYREFNDDQSFKDLARREILLWLRNICNSAKEAVPEPEKVTSLIKSGIEETNFKVTPSSSSNNIGIKVKKDMDLLTRPSQEAKSSDCIDYITSSSPKLFGDLNAYTQYSKDLMEYAGSFKDRIMMLKMRKKFDTDMVMMCQQFSQELDMCNSGITPFLRDFESNWIEMYQYLISFNREKLKYEDRFIMRDYISSLKNSLQIVVFDLLPKAIDIITSVPIAQKDLKLSLDKTLRLNKRFKTIANRAFNNCEELEGLLL